MQFPGQQENTRYNNTVRTHTHKCSDFETGAVKRLRGAKSEPHASSAHKKSDEIPTTVLVRGTRGTSEQALLNFHARLVLCSAGHYTTPCSCDEYVHWVIDI